MLLISAHFKQIFIQRSRWLHPILRERTWFQTIFQSTYPTIDLSEDLSNLGIVWDVASPYAGAIFQFIQNHLSHCQYMLKHSWYPCTLDRHPYFSKGLTSRHLSIKCKLGNALDKSNFLSVLSVYNNMIRGAFEQHRMTSYNCRNFWAFLVSLLRSSWNGKVSMSAGNYTPDIYYGWRRSLGKIHFNHYVK